VITAVAAKAVDSREAFSPVTSTLASGQPLELTIAREGATRSINIRPAEPPSDLGLRVLWEIAGLRVGDGRGVVIEEVSKGSRAENIGLAPGDSIVGINGTEVSSVNDLNRELTRSVERSSIVLSVARGRFVYNLTFPMAM